MLEIALACIARGWHVFPCWPETKKPMLKNGWHGASVQEAQIRSWWARNPNANVAIATLFSALTVWDCDHGFTCREDFEQFASKHGLPKTYAVRSGRRDSYGVQMYFTGEQIASVKWSFDGCAGDFRSNTGYVMAVGSIHDISGERYEPLWDNPLQELPGVFRDLKKPETDFTLEGKGELDALRVALEHYGIDYEDKGDKLWVACPWAREHTAYSGPSEAALFVKRGLYCFKCHHASCDGRSYSQYRSEVTK
jgi:hypothetical protein